MKWFIDTVERVLVTFLEAWLGAWVAFSDKSFELLWDGKVLLVGLTAAILSLLKCLAALNIGRTDSASLSPKV